MDEEIVENIVHAISNGRTDIVRAFVLMFNKDSGKSESNTSAVLNSLSCSEGTVLHLSTKLDQVDIVRTLLSAGANPNIQNSSGETPYDLIGTERMRSVYIEELLKCSAKSDLLRMEELLESGVNVDSQDSPFSGNTALHWAASYGNVDAVQFLLDHGALINITNADGATPLHDSISRKDVDITKKLIGAGADLLVKATNGIYKGKRPIDLASDDKEMNELLFSESLPSSDKAPVNGDLCQVSSSLESLRLENGFVESVGKPSVSTPESPAKQHVSTPTLQSMSDAFTTKLLLPPPLITDSQLHLLWPMPQEIVQNEGSSFKPKDKYSVCVLHGSGDVNDVLHMWKSHSGNFSELNVECVVEDIVASSTNTRRDIVCHINERLFSKQQCYKLVVTSEEVRISASDTMGLHYGICTLLQLFKLYQGEEGIPPVYIEDWPILPCRGVLLDLSVGSRKPTIETFGGLIRVLSTLKLNEVYLYFRLSSVKWPYSNSDLLAMLECCRECHLTPIPAVDIPNEATIDCIAAYSTDILHILHLFSSRTLHLGPTLSSMIFDMLLQSSSNSMSDVLPLPHDCLVYLCTNGYTANPKLIQSLPRNIVLMEYGYQADFDFDTPIHNAALSGLPFGFGVGTSSWGSIGGCPETATNIIFKASQSAFLHRALCMIIADWKTIPHHSALCFSWPGIVQMAGLSWNSSVHLDFLHSRLSELLNHCVFKDKEPMLGYLIVELGRLEAFVHRSSHRPKENSTVSPITPASSASTSVLLQLFLNPDEIIMDHFTVDLLQQAVRHMKKFEMDLKKVQPQCFQKGELVAELQLAIDMQMFACKLAKVLVTNGQNPSPSAGFNSITNVGVVNLPPIAKTDLANRLLGLVEQFRAVWLSRNLPCGLHESLYLFNSLLHKFIPNSDHYFASAEGFVRQ